MAKRPNKNSSDFVAFCMKVYDASATYMEFDVYYDLYSELLKFLWWNYEVDMPLAVHDDTNPSGVVFGQMNNGVDYE